MKTYLIEFGFLGKKEYKEVF